MRLGYLDPERLDGSDLIHVAAFALSRVAFVDPVPRPEDFGVFDFVCVLAAQEGKNIYPESAFFVQVKSDSGPIDLDADALRWITQHMDQPLMICVISKSESTLTLYSCARLWWPLPTALRGGL